MQQLNEYSSGIDGKGEFVWMLHVALSFDGEKHRSAVVDEELAAQVGLLLELFDIETICAAVEMPVYMTDALAGVVLAIVREFGRKTMERTTVPAGDKSLDYLPCEEVEGFVFVDV